MFGETKGGRCDIIISLNTRGHYENDECNLRFLNEYKRLDKLCAEMNGERTGGVSAYLADMEKYYSASGLVKGFGDDYKTLKYYRGVRNRLVHEPDSLSEPLCNEDDINWIVDFHNRILRAEDPLTTARKARESQARQSAGKQKQKSLPEKEKNCGLSTPSATNSNPPQNIQHKKSFFNQLATNIKNAFEKFLAKNKGQERRLIKNVHCDKFFERRSLFRQKSGL